MTRKETARLQAGQVVTFPSQHTVTEQFRDAISAAGLEPPAEIHADGGIHRFSSNGKRGDDSGWYVLHLDGIPGGAFGCFRSVPKQKWSANIGRPLTQDEQRQERERVERAEKLRDEEQQRRQETAKQRAAELWDRAKPADESHPYLQRKRIKPHGLRVDAEGTLLVPMRAGGVLWGLQSISADGSKRFLPGQRAKGLCYPLRGTGGVILVVEGFATAATLHEATAHNVVAAFSASNLEPVARAMRQKYPAMKIVICADDDWRSRGNPGMAAATSAARAIGGLVARPDFGGFERGEKDTDFNDLAAKRGAEAVRACIERASSPDAMEPPKESQAEPKAADTPSGAKWPEPRPLPPELHPVAAFDFNLLPDSLRPWIEDVCERVQCPPDFVAVPATVALGSLIGRKVRIRPKARDSWTVVPNVWGCVIGRPGAMKSPAVAEALHPLRRLEAQARDEFTQLHGDWETAVEVAKLHKEVARDSARKALRGKKGEVSAETLRVEIPVEPTMRRYSVHSSSVQALGELLRENPNGLLVERDELAGLLTSLSQEERAEDRGFYLTGADGVMGYGFDTIGRGLHRSVPAVCLSILGTSQPGKIGRFLRQAQAGGNGDDGMMQRFGLLVWPDSSRDWLNVDRWPDSDARQQAFDVYDRLDRLQPADVAAELEHDVAFLRFAPDALELFTEWRMQLEARLRSETLHPALESHFAKYRKTIPALALIFHLAEGGTGPVSLESTVRALAWAEYLETHALRAYGATVAAELRAARRILCRIREGALPDGFRAREIDRAQWSELTDRETVRGALGLLVSHGYLVEIDLPPTAAGGRPTLAYRIHPSLLS